MPTLLGLNPGTDNLQMIKDGDQVAGLAIDQQVASWTLLDIAAREITGQPLTAAEAQGNPVMEFLTSSDVTSIPASGWTGYPDYAQLFAKLWGVS